MQIGMLLFGMESTLHASPAPAFLQQMAGCFSVTYNFVENGDNDEFFEPVLEKATLEESDDVIHIRRTLIVGDQVQPHWREEWRLLDAAANTWEQTVYGPFEDLRYRCSGLLIEDSWRCEALAAPKPRRDQDKPYAKLDRENTLKVNAKRWIHMQKNVKKMVDQSVYGIELGWNRYDRQDDAACTPSQRPR